MTQPQDDFFGEVISSYSRAQAIEDGALWDLMQDETAEVCRQHYRFPIATTSAVFEIIRKAVENPRACNDYKGVIHDMLWMSKVMKRRLDDSTVLFRVKINGAGRKSLYEFKLTVGPGDHGEPVITIMLPDED